MQRLEGKVAIITGSGRGIGKAIARKFLLEGSRVMLCDIVAERIGEAAHELSLLGDVHAMVGDVSTATFCDSLVLATINKFGEINVLINNAGIAIFAPFLKQTESDWDRTLSVNLKSMFLLGQRAAIAMVAQGKGGVIINMASTNGLLAESNLSAYNASKGGVVMLTKSMAVELAQHNIRVNCVAPGLIRTDLATEGGIDDAALSRYLERIPMRRSGSPDEVANLFAYLASDEASYITGDAVVIDSGQISEE